MWFQSLTKQDNLDAFNEKDPYKADDAREEEDDHDDNDNSLETEPFPKGLPWAPKVRCVCWPCWRWMRHASLNDHL